MNPPLLLTDENAADVIKGFAETVTTHSFVSKLIDLKAEATLFKGSTEHASKSRKDVGAVIVYGSTLKQYYA